MTKYVTAKQALSECLVIIEARSRSVSRNMANQEAADGYGPLFDLEQARCRAIRKIIQQIDSGEPLNDEVEMIEADWQQVIRENPEKALVMDL